jgi:hypothetical protein
MFQDMLFPCYEGRTSRNLEVYLVQVVTRHVKCHHSVLVHLAKSQQSKVIYGESVILDQLLCFSTQQRYRHQEVPSVAAKTSSLFGVCIESNRTSMTTSQFAEKKKGIDSLSCPVWLITGVWSRYTSCSLIFRRRSARRQLYRCSKKHVVHTFAVDHQH